MSNAFDPSTATPEELALARHKFEAERITRRSALRKFGITTGMSVFGMFAADDLARMVIKKMEEHKETRQIAETVAHEFKNSGVAFADSSGDTLSAACTKCFTDAETQSDNCGNIPAGPARDSCNTNANSTLTACLKTNNC